jgi:hypothetical protein
MSRKPAGVPALFGFVVLAALNVNAQAERYEINFITATGVTPAGSFSYDASQPVNPFSNFVVEWNGATFDLTASANDPKFGKAATSLCFPSLNATGVFYALTHPAGCEGFPKSGWSIQPQRKGPAPSGSKFQFTIVEEEEGNGLTMLAVCPKCKADTVAGTWEITRRAVSQFVRRGDPRRSYWKN